MPFLGLMVLEHGFFVGFVMEWGETLDGRSSSSVNPRPMPTEINSIEPVSVTGGCSYSSDGPASGGLEIVASLAYLNALFEGIMTHNVSVQEAKVLFEPLLAVSQMRCTLTRFHMHDLAIHYLLSLKPPLAGGRVHVLTNTEFIPRGTPFHLDLYSSRVSCYTAVDYP